MTPLTILILFTLFTNTNHLNDNSLNPSTVNELVIKVEDVGKIIEHVNELRELRDWDRSVIVLIIEEKEQHTELRATFLYKSSFIWYMKIKPGALYGFFNYRGITVLVFGDDAEYFFLKTDRTKHFDYLEVKTEYDDDPEIEELDIPSIFEPFELVYHYVDRKLIFIEEGYFYPFK